MNIMQTLHAVGLNPFGVVLVAESLLKSPIAHMSAGDEPLTFFMPINREDCAGWLGVEFTLKAVRAEQPKTAPCPPSQQGKADPFDYVIQHFNSMPDKALALGAVMDRLCTLRARYRAGEGTQARREAPFAVSDEMVNRFLSWRLPEDFFPDGGISFTTAANRAWPTGTNLLHAGQAKAMLEHVLGGEA